VGDKNGSNTLYTLPGGQAYLPGTLSVFLNGQQYNPANIQQIGPGYTTFQIVNGDHVPQSVDTLSINYVLA